MDVWGMSWPKKENTFSGQYQDFTKTVRIYDGDNGSSYLKSLIALNFPLGFPLITMKLIDASSYPSTPFCAKALNKRKFIKEIPINFVKCFLNI